MNKMPASDTWKSLPGNFDALNTFWLPEMEAGMPIIPAYKSDPPARLIRYGTDRRRFKEADAVHFFLDDYRFESVWRYPERVAASFVSRIVLSPDFSVYTDWPIEVQRWNIYRSRWCGAFWANRGAVVIPTVSWAEEPSFEFAFSGLAPGGAVAISTIGVPSRSPEFVKGFDALLAKVNPAVVLCYGEFQRAYGAQHRLVFNYEYQFGYASKEGVYALPVQ